MLRLVQRGGDWARLQPIRPLLSVPNVTADSVTILLYNGPLPFSFNVPMKGLVYSFID